MKFAITNGKLFEINVEDSDRRVNDPTWHGLRLIILFNGGANFKEPFLTSGNSGEAWLNPLNKKISHLTALV